MAAMDEAPPFWWTRPGPLAWALSPLSLLWGSGAARRMEMPPSASVGIPVLCIGNFIAGGAGKTPTALALARAARQRGRIPGFLSRGYGGRMTGPALVDPDRHRAIDVGDEPLLLAANAMTAISADRPAGADLLAANGCDFLIMDDGFQNPALEKDYSLVVVDARRGIGNGFAIPAGPLRAPLGRQLGMADAVLVIGEGSGADKVIRSAARRAKPVHRAAMRPLSREAFKGKWFLAFAGIADPQKFFDSLKACGAELFEMRGFPDHHPYSEEEAGELLEKAEFNKVALVTTAKDMARMRGAGGVVEKLAEAAQLFEVELEFEDPRVPALVVDATLSRAEQRMLRRRPAAV